LTSEPWRSSWERWRLAGEFRFSAPDWPAGRRRSQEVHGKKKSAFKFFNAKTRRFWTAVAERSGDTALGSRPMLKQRRGASLPAALQKVCFAPLRLCAFALKFETLVSRTNQKGLTGHGRGASFPRSQAGGKGQGFRALAFPGKRHQMTK
jgi:hypothetical protein